jgi:hypothetical protein
LRKNIAKEFGILKLLIIAVYNASNTIFLLAGEAMMALLISKSSESMISFLSDS